MRFLVVKLDQYAGNVDEIVSVALTGLGNDRYDSEAARILFEEKVEPIIGEDYLDFCYFNTEYGRSMYELDSKSTDYLRLCIDDHVDLYKIIEIWKQAYENLIIKMDNRVIKILGFDLVEVVEYRTTL